MNLLYCDACGVRVDAETAVVNAGRTLCRACAGKPATPRPPTAGSGLRAPVRSASGLRAPVSAPPLVAAGGATQPPRAGSGIRAPIRSTSGLRVPVSPPPSSRRTSAPGAQPAPPIARSKITALALAGGGVLLAILGVILLLSTGGSGTTNPSQAPAPPTHQPVAASRPAPVAPASAAPAALPASAATVAQRSDLSAAGYKAPITAQTDEKAAEERRQRGSSLLVADMDDIRESSAQRELDGILELEKSGKSSPYEVRLRCDRLAASRGGTKAGKIAAEKAKTLPSLSAAVNLAQGKPAEGTGTEAPHTPARAVDGDLSLDSSWWAGPGPQSLTVDLQQAQPISLIHFFPYWSDGRYYQYTIDASKDGNEWQKVVDQSANTRLSVPDGFMHGFAPVEARYVRVNMLKNSVNPSMHIVELRVYSAPEAKPAP